MIQRELDPSAVDSRAALPLSCAQTGRRLRAAYPLRACNAILTAFCLQVKLSDRNIVELVNKLQECGLLGDDLLHTINGREYVTAEHLKSEVVDAVKGTGGRIAVVSE